jgi:hypothetical protein
MNSSYRFHQLDLRHVYISFYFVINQNDIGFLSGFLRHMISLQNIKIPR